VDLLFSPQILRFGTLALVCTAVGWAVHHVASLPTMAPRRLGLRGVARARALTRHGLFRFVEPFVRWLSVRVNPLMTDAQRDSLDKMLTRAGDPLGIEPAELWVLCGMLGFFGSTLGITYAATRDKSPLYGVFLGLVLVGLPFSRIQNLVEERARSVRIGLPAVVDLLCLSLSAGLDFPSAVRQIVDKSSKKDDALTEELAVVLSELSLGKTRREALETFGARNPGPSVQEFVASVIQAEEEGTPLAEVLQIQAKISRQRRSVRAEEAASKASLQLLMPMALVFLCVLILIGAPLALTLIKGLSRGS
jgi:tight adherence protein C